MSDEHDRIRIHEVIGLHGHLVDEGEFQRFDEVFTDDVVYDVTALGGTRMTGAAAIAAAGRVLGTADPLGHHVTNIVVLGIEGDRAQARSKGLAVMTDGTTGSVVYDDEIRRTDRGWRIAVRRVLPPSDPAPGVRGSGRSGQSTPLTMRRSRTAPPSRAARAAA